MFKEKFTAKYSYFRIFAVPGKLKRGTVILECVPVPVVQIYMDNCNPPPFDTIIQRYTCVVTPVKTLKRLLGLTKKMEFKTFIQEN